MFFHSASPSPRGSKKERVDSVCVTREVYLVRQITLSALLVAGCCPKRCNVHACRATCMRAERRAWLLHPCRASRAHLSLFQAARRATGWRAAPPRPHHLVEL